MFRGSVKSTGYPLHQFPPSPPTPAVRRREPSRFNWTLPLTVDTLGSADNVQSIFYLLPRSEKLVGTNSSHDRAHNTLLHVIKSGKVWATDKKYS